MFTSKMNNMKSVRAEPGHAMPGQASQPGQDAVPKEQRAEVLVPGSCSTVFMANEKGNVQYTHTSHNCKGCCGKLCCCCCCYCGWPSSKLIMSSWAQGKQRVAQDKVKVSQSHSQSQPELATWRILNIILRVSQQQVLNLICPKTICLFALAICYRLPQELVPSMWLKTRSRIKFSY